MVMVEEIKPYTYDKKSAWDIFTDDQVQHAYMFCEGYKEFLSEVKTEREAVHFIKRYVEKKGKKIFLNKHGGAAVVVKGSKPLSEGIVLVISHVDSPRLDLKQVPLFEDKDSNLALFETHYYGGIKKFHWVTIPLALHGVVAKKDGTTVTFRLGEDLNDPVFAVADLLPHLSHDIQDTKKMSEAIKGESLDIVVGNKPVKDSEKDKLKNTILEKLYEEYGLVEEDFISADIEAVPAYLPRDIGFDKSMIGAYGQDDRACVYASLNAIIDIEAPEYTAIALFADKEEIGSEGSTSAQVFTFLRSILKQMDPDVDVDTVMLHSRVISADVDAAVTPNYVEAFETKNASTLGGGVAMVKFTGHGGKYSANDAPAEYVASIRRILSNNKIPWQTGELGRVDNGGGGTVAKYFSRLGMMVIDMGPPVLSMHAPFEVTSKLDIYAAYLAYKAFFKTNHF